MNQSDKSRIKIETTKAYGKFNLAQKPWMPEVRSGDSLKSLIADIKVNGLLEPIIADQNGMIFVGRSRYLACKAAKVALRVHRISTKDAELQSKSRQLLRYHTVLDRVRFVEWVRSELKQQDKPGKMRVNLSKTLRETWGWTTGASEGQVQKYEKILELLANPKRKSKIEKVLRDSAHLHEAYTNLFPDEDPGAKASTKSETGAVQKAGVKPEPSVAAKSVSSPPDITSKLQSALKKLGSDPARAKKPELVKFVEKVRALVEPKQKPKTPPKETP